ncbi:MAG: hypothetical protein ACTSUK_06915 [Promethearchaeota archaeon]
MVKAEVFKTIGYFDETLDHLEDLDIWARIARQYEFFHLPESLVNIRVHQSNASNPDTEIVEKFVQYLTKAIERDNQLSKRFRRQVFSNLYNAAANVILIDGDSSHMRIIRQYYNLALKHWPFSINAILGIMITFLNLNTRQWLGSNFRKTRYPKHNS